MNFQFRVRHVLTDIEDMDFLIEIWPEVNGIEQVTASVPVILSVDLVAFRPRIAIDEKGNEEGFEECAQLKAPGIFSQFVFNLYAFRDFLMEHFE
jgi:hypothetical protein